MPARVRQDLFEPEWQELAAPSLAKGLVTSRPADQIDDEQLAECENFSLHNGILHTDSGYTQLGTNTLRGTPRKVFEHRTPTGSATLLAVTDDTVYRYSATADQWQYAQDSSNATTLNANEAMGSTALDVVDETIVSGGDHIGIILDDGTEHQTTVASTSPGIINIDDALPSAAASGKPVTKAVDLNGTSGNQISFAHVPSDGWTVFTNGTDKPLYFDGTSVELLPNLPSGGNIVCKAVMLVRDAYLTLMNIVDAGTSKPYRLIWSDTGNPAEWSAGNAGGKDLFDSRDPIVGGKPFGPSALIYRTRGNVRMELTGDQAVFQFIPMVYGEESTKQGLGAVSPNSIFAANDVHFVFGARRFYIYRGGLSAEVIDDDIFKLVLGVGGLADKSKLHLNFVHYIDDRDEVWFIFADSISSTPNQAVVYDRRAGAWWRRKFTRGITAAGLRSAASGARIIDLEGNIAEQDWVIGTGPLVEGSEAMLFASADGNIYQYDLSSTTEAGTQIEALARSREYRSSYGSLRFDTLEVITVGSSMTFGLDYDDGKKSVSLGTTPISGVPIRSKFHRQITSPSFQLSITANGGASLLGWSVRFRRESRWSL